MMRTEPVRLVSSPPDVHVTDPTERTHDDTQEVKVRLTASTGDFNGTDVEVLWPNANNASQFTGYEMHKSTIQGFAPSHDPPQ